MHLTRQLVLPLDAELVRGLLDPVRLMEAVPGAQGHESVRLLPRRRETAVRVTVRVSAEVQQQADGTVIDLACTLDLGDAPTRELSAAAERLADQLAANVEAELLDLAAARRPLTGGGAARVSVLTEHRPTTAHEPESPAATAFHRDVTRGLGWAVAGMAALALVTGFVWRRRRR